MIPASGSIIARRFQLVRELGRGTMGTVWLADHLTLGLRCAVKFMTAEATQDPNYRARFQLEARAIAQLSSPNVVRVLDYDVCEDVPFIAMERLHGEDLEARLSRVGRLDAVATHRIVSQVAHGLARAHAAGIVHRDLKPGNIFLAQEDDDEVAKLLDFGIAKYSPAGAVGGVDHGTQIGALLGTPVYMSPEQARGVRAVDYRSDLWSLAVIAYECLAGQLPFDGPSLGDVFARVMFEPIPVPSRVSPGLSPAFDAWWEKAASRDVERRYASAGELAAALGRALGISGARLSAGDLSSARSLDPPPPPRRRRRSGVPATLLAVAIVLVALVVPSVRIDPALARAQIESHLRSAAHSLTQSAGGMSAEPRVVAPRAEPPTPSAEPVQSAPAPASQAPSAIHPEVTVRLAEPPPAKAPPEPRENRALKQTPAVRSGQQDAREPEARPVPGAECEAEQHRCRGRELQVCNATFNGWRDVSDCGAAAICDATGSGRCVPLTAAEAGAEPPAAGEENPY